MKRYLWLVLIFLVAIVLLFISCTRNVPEAQTEADTETVITVTSSTTELKGENETTTTATSPTTEPKVETESTTTIAPTTHEPVPTIFSVSDLTITPQEVTANSPVTIEVLVTNTGELSDSYGVILWIDDTVENGESITLEGGASQKVTFTVTKWITGTYSVSIKELSGTFLVRPLPLPDMGEFMKGIAYNDEAFEEAWPVMPRPPVFGPLYNPRQVDVSLKIVADTGANWISVIVNGSQESYASTKITRDEYRTASDEALRYVIDLAHSLGIRVILNPALYNLPHVAGRSWIDIGTAFTSEAQWQEWFESYREFINHYATFAQEAGVDMMYVGSELPNTIHREKDWRRVVKEVRERYTGLISYDSVCWGYPSAEYQRIKWWDAVDYIVVDFCLPLTNKNDPTVAELKEGLMKTGYLTNLENISKQYNKPIIISEISYWAIDGANRQLVNFQTGTPDLQEQADCYQATFEVLWGKPWLKGIFWYQYYVCAPGGLQSPQDKPAEEVIKKYYLSDE